MFLESSPLKILLVHMHSALGKVVTKLLIEQIIGGLVALRVIVKPLSLMKLSTGDVAFVSQQIGITVYIWKPVIPISCSSSVQRYLERSVLTFNFHFNFQEPTGLQFPDSQVFKALLCFQSFRYPKMPRCAALTICQVVSVKRVLLYGYGSS
mmetsp:Transcript_16384/g.35741  ORF Transcript_16384/g.35741 Transcript_16384/m.35741 type:complete len:152 (+) Transcript_16384:474-929(+)